MKSGSNDDQRQETGYRSEEIRRFENRGAVDQSHRLLPRVGSSLIFRFWGSARKLLIRQDFWLRGVDLNHRPLGYERIDLLLSSSIYGTSGIVRKRK